MSDREITTRMAEARDADVYLRRAMRAEAERDRLREALGVALEAMERSAADHHCDYCRADVAAVKRVLADTAQEAPT